MRPKPAPPPCAPRSWRHSLGKTIKTYAMCTVIHGASDAAAEKTAQHYREGLDEGAVLGMLESYGATLPATTMPWWRGPRAPS